ncbi:MAG TPA: ChaN family lipoprotein [Candidatus Limnocylindrales bacterium]|nr:ChaN family lipoprotein [Candidatus Limnocylindrales bacterium]
MARQKFVSPDHLVRVAGSADAVLLGEQHDNPDHHQLQAWVLQRLVERRRRPAVAFEQLDFEDQPAVDEVLQRRGDAEQLDVAVQWSRSGWPPFEIYRPVFEVALQEGLSIRAANLSRARLRDPNLLDEIAVPLPQRLRNEMAQEIAEAHCGHASGRMTEAMILMQRHRDAHMAAALADACGVAATRDGPASAAGVASEARRDVGDSDGSCVLIAGFGHVRRDRGVPLYLRHQWPQLRVVSVAFLEVAENLEHPQDYAAAFGDDPRPFDYFWFTPAIARPDPCVEFRRQLEGLAR